MCVPKEYTCRLACCLAYLAACFLAHWAACQTACWLACLAACQAAYWTACWGGGAQMVGVASPCHGHSQPSGADSSSPAHACWGCHGCLTSCWAGAPGSELGPHCSSDQPTHPTAIQLPVSSAIMQHFRVQLLSHEVVSLHVTMHSTLIASSIHLQQVR